MLTCSHSLTSDCQISAQVILSSHGSKTICFSCRYDSASAFRADILGFMEGCMRVGRIPTSSLCILDVYERLLIELEISWFTSKKQSYIFFPVGSCKFFGSVSNLFYFFKPNIFDVVRYGTSAVQRFKTYLAQPRLLNTIRQAPEVDVYMS